MNGNCVTERSIKLSQRKCSLKYMKEENVGSVLCEKDLRLYVERGENDKVV